jgi:hypothetical protein
MAGGVWIVELFWVFAGDAEVDTAVSLNILPAQLREGWNKLLSSCSGDLGDL